MDCIFCKIIQGQLKTNYMFEDELVIAFRDIKPIAPTHILLVPKLHIATLNDLKPEHNTLMGHMLLTAPKIAAAENIDSTGYRLVFNVNAAAGQTVFHIHLHILGQRTFNWPPG